MQNKMRVYDVVAGFEMVFGERDFKKAFESF